MLSKQPNIECGVDNVKTELGYFKDYQELLCEHVRIGYMMMMNYSFMIEYSRLL